MWPFKKKEHVDIEYAVMLQQFNDELQESVNKLAEDNKKLIHAALTICDKYVAPDFYAKARAEIDKITKKPTEESV